MTGAGSRLPLRADSGRELQPLERSRLVSKAERTTSELMETFVTYNLLFGSGRGISRRRPNVENFAFHTSRIAFLKRAFIRRWVKLT